MTGSEYLLLGSFGLLLLLGVPFAFAIGVSVCAALWANGIDLVVVPQHLMSGISLYALLSIPCFILAGDLMYTGGLSRSLVNIAMVLFGRRPGGAAIVAVTSATAFGAITGSANATTAAIGKATIPEMVRRGYSREFSAALAATYGPIGILIPPSIPLIIWGVIANQSITALFIAGIVPGILLACGLVVMSYWHAKRHGIPVDEDRFSLARFGRVLLEGKWALLAPVVILGGIYGGIFTPTEAGAVGVLYGASVGFIQGTIRISDLPGVVIRSMKTSAVILYIVGMSAAFTWMMGYNSLPDRLGEMLLSISSNPIVVLLIINIFLLMIGSFMDELAAIIILSTFLIHVGNTIGVDPIHFGIIILMNIAIGLTTPPLGYTLFTASAISGVPMDRLVRPVIPLIAIQICSLLIVTYVPEVSLFLVHLF